MPSPSILHMYLPMISVIYNQPMISMNYTVCDHFNSKKHSTKLALDFQVPLGQPCFLFTNSLHLRAKWWWREIGTERTKTRQIFKTGETKKIECWPRSSGFFQIKKKLFPQHLGPYWACRWHFQRLPNNCKKLSACKFKPLNLDYKRIEH